MNNHVKPRLIAATGFIGNIFTGKKKWEITCGKCHETWKVKLPIAEQNRACCPRCAAINTWSSSKFYQDYDFLFGD